MAEGLAPEHGPPAPRLNFAELDDEAKYKVREIYNDSHVDNLQWCLNDFLAEQFGCEDGDAFDSEFEVEWSISHSQGDYVNVTSGWFNGADVEHIEAWCETWAGEPAEWATTDFYPQHIDFCVTRSEGNRNYSYCDAEVNDADGLPGLSRAAFTTSSQETMFACYDSSDNAEEWFLNAVDRISDLAIQHLSNICYEALHLLLEWDLSDDFFAAGVEGLLFESDGTIADY